MEERKGAFERISGFPDDLLAMTDHDRLLKVVAALLPAFGFEGIAVADFPVDGAPAHIYLASVPDDWTNFATDWALAFDDPCVRTAMHGLKPFMPDEFSPRPAAMCRALATADGAPRQAFVVPVHKPATGIGSVSFFAGEISLSPERRTSVRLFSVYVFDRALALAPGAAPVDDAPPAPALTARERQCMEFVASGLSDAQIAERLGISWSTAHFHVERARRKLGARNRAHAVAVAVRQRLV